MFKITDYKIDNGTELFGVLDTEDNSLEFLTADTIKDIVKRTGFKIDDSQVSTLKANYKSSQSYDISKYHSLDNVIKLYTTKGLFVGKSRFECIKELYKIMIKEVPELKDCLTFRVSKTYGHPDGNDEIYYTSEDFYKKAPEFIPYVESLQALMLLGDWKLYKSIMGKQWDNVKFRFEKFDKYKKHCGYGFGEGCVTPLDVNTWDDLHAIYDKFKSMPDNIRSCFPIRCSDDFISGLESIDFKSYLLHSSPLLDSAIKRESFGGKDCIICILDCIFNNNPCKISHLDKDKDKIINLYYKTTGEHISRSEFSRAIYYYLINFLQYFRNDNYICNMDVLNDFRIINSSGEKYKPKFLIDMNSFSHNLESLIEKLYNRAKVNEEVDLF